MHVHVLGVKFCGNFFCFLSLLFKLWSVFEFFISVFEILVLISLFLQFSFIILLFIVLCVLSLLFVCLFVILIFVSFYSFVYLFSISVNDWKWSEFHSDWNVFKNLNVIVVDIDTSNSYIKLIYLVVREVLVKKGNIRKRISSQQLSVSVSVSRLHTMKFKFLFFVVWIVFLIFSFICFSICLSPNSGCLVYFCCVFVLHCDIFIFNYVLLVCLFILFSFNILISVSCCYIFLFKYYLLFCLFFVLTFFMNVELFIQGTIGEYIDGFFIFVVLWWWVVVLCVSLSIRVILVQHISIMILLQVFKWIQYLSMKSKYEINRD